MTKFASIAIVFSAVFLVGNFADAGKKPLQRDILGLHLDMPKAEAQKQLQTLGKFVREESKRQEIWEIRDPSFSHVVIGFDAKDLTRYVTAVAREDKEAKRLKYADIGDLDAARQAGDPAVKNFNYEWALAAEKRDPEMLVIVRGRDPEFFSTYSLKRIGGETAEAEEKD